MVGATAAASLFALNAQERSIRREAFMSPFHRLVQAAEPRKAELRAAWASLQSPLDDVRLDRDQEAVVDAARAAVDADIADRLARIEALLADGIGPRQDLRFGEGVQLAPLASKALAGIALAIASEAEYPGHQRLAELAALESVFTEVVYRLGRSIPRPLDGFVEFQVVDHFTGALSEPELLGPLPTGSRRLPPGSYRFTAVLEDGRFSELDRHLIHEPANAVDLAFWPRHDRELADRLVLVEPAGDSFDLGAERGYGCITPGNVVTLEPYWIDQLELSNADFVDYLVDTGAKVPNQWVSLGFDLRAASFLGAVTPVDFDQAAWRRLPATGMSFDNLRGCAEWRGCRVPTHLELEYAHRGPDRLLLPVGYDNSFRTNGNVADRTGGGLDSYWDSISHLRPVDDPTARALHLGLFHVAGNVKEWTSSHVILSAGETLRTNPQSRLLLSGDWLKREKRLDLSSHSTDDVGRDHLSDRSGLRCARSRR